MSDVVFKLVADPSQFIAGVKVADNAQTELNKEVVQFGKDSKKVYDDAAKGPEKLGDGTDKVKEKTKSLKAQYAELKKQIAEATDADKMQELAMQAGELKDRIDDANEAAGLFASGSKFEILGSQFGDIASKLRNMDFSGAAERSALLVKTSKSLTFKEGIQGVKDLGVTFLNVGKSLLMNPIFLLGTALTLIITNFDKLKNAGGVIGKVFSAIGDAIQLVIDMGSDFLDFIGLIDNAQKSLEELTKMNEAYMANVTARYDLEIAKAKAAGKESIKIEKQKAEAILANQRIVISETKKAFDRGEIDAKEYAEKLQAIGLAINKAEINLLNIRGQERQKAAEKQKKAADELAQALLDLLKKSNAAELSMLTGKEKLDFQKKLAEEEVAELEKALKKKLQAAGKGNKLSLEQEREVGNLKTAINREYYQGLLQLAIQEAQKEANIQKSKNDTLISDFELRNTIVKNGINSVVAVEGATNLEREVLEQERQTLLLDNEKKYQQEKLALTLKGIEAEMNVKKASLQAELNIVSQKTDAVSVARTSALEEEIASINASGELAKQAAIGSTQNAINGVEAEIRKNDLNKKLTGYKIDWARLFGVSDAELNSIKDNLNKLASEGAKIIGMYLDFQEQTLNKELEVTEKKKALREQEISELESKLKKENELKNDGLANDSQRLQDELAEKKRQRDDALAEEKRIKKEQEKLAREQMLIDTATQASSLVTAIAQIFASTAEAGPIGVVLAGVTIAAMLASFAYSQGQAYAAINKSDSSFAGGGYTGDGGKYEEAGTVHKGEFVTTKEKTKRYRNLLEGIHKDDNKLIEKGLVDLLKGTGVSLSNLPEELSSKKSFIKQAEYAMYMNGNNSGVEKRLDTLSNKFDALNSGLNDSVTYLENGTKIIRKGVNETIIRKRNK